MRSYYGEIIWKVMMFIKVLKILIHEEMMNVWSATGVVKILHNY